MDPDAIRGQRFLLVRRGYDPEAVQEFLDDVATAIEDLRARLDDGDDTSTELVEANRLVDEARTRAATHRLRAQRDVEALERTARQRRARLLDEIEELAAARDQLSTDLDRAVDVVDRVVQWVRRTDPSSGRAAGTVEGATPSMAASDPVDHPSEQDEDPRRSATDVPDQSREPDESPDQAAHEVPDEPADEALDEAADQPPDEAADEAFAEAGPGAILDRDDEQVEVAAGDDGADAPTVGHAPPDATGLEAAPEEGEPATGAVREALRRVQDEVLANLGAHPRKEVADWLPSRAVLDGLDDATTDASDDAFLAGWTAAADGDGDEGPGGEAAVDRARGRDVLEEVRAAGHLPGLDVAGDLQVALQASLARGRDAGDVEVALRERVAEVHRDLRQTRLPEAIEHVLATARHRGQVARWRQDGVAAVEWVEGPERRCPGRRCRGNATDGVVAPGQAFAFGDVVPPAHPGCTCTLRPVREDRGPSSGPPS